MTNTEELARQWAEDFRALKESGRDLSPTTEAAMAYILEHTLATAEPSKPPTMADIQWDHDTHFLAEAEGESGVKIAMIGMKGDNLHGVVTDSTKSYFYQKGGHLEDCLPERFTPTGRKYTLVINETDDAEPLPEPKYCNPGEHYLVQLYDGDVVAAERREPGAAYPWGASNNYHMDEDITILARLVPDREVPHV